MLLPCLPESAEVERDRLQRPLAADRINATQQEAAHTVPLFEDAEDRFHDLLA